METLGSPISDALFGFRVYPITQLSEVMMQSRFMRRFDFDAEAIVRLAWRGVPIVNLAAPVRYLSPQEGGISHFHYLRDNITLSAMHARLLYRLITRLAGRLKSCRH
jgi:hypothetical protein